MRKEYRIIVLNGSGVEVYNEIYLSKNENDAMIDFLKYNVVFCGDTITIEEE